MYVAAGQADTLAVWKRDDSKTQLTYVPLFTFKTPTNTYFVESNSISFASGAEILAVGWINIQGSQSTRHFLSACLYLFNLTDYYIFLSIIEFYDFHQIASHQQCLRARTE